MRFVAACILAGLVIGMLTRCNGDDVPPAPPATPQYYPFDGPPTTCADYIARNIHNDDC